MASAVPHKNPTRKKTQASSSLGRHVNRSVMVARLTAAPKAKRGGRPPENKLVN